MKKLLCLTLLFVGCSTAPKPQPLTFDSCVASVKDRVGYSKYNTEEKENSLMAIWIICNKAGNDPDRAMKILDQLLHSH